MPAGRPTTEAKQKYLFYIGKKDYKILKALCRKKKVPVAETIRNLIKKYLHS